jgi:hypothetical protein
MRFWDILLKNTQKGYLRFKRFGDTKVYPQTKPKKAKKHKKARFWQNEDFCQNRACLKKPLENPGNQNHPKMLFQKKPSKEFHVENVRTLS